jgi:predicted outer membrane repeat protein
MFTKNNLAAIWVAASVSLALAPGARAALWRVPADLPSIADAVAAAADGDTVEIACGAWSEHGLVITRGVTLRGATANPACVVIDGGGQGRVLDVAGASGPVVLENLTISGGLVEGAFFDAAGGAVRVENAALTINDCAIRGNTAVIGGGVAVRQGTLKVHGTVFEANAASDETWAAGGGIWCRESDGYVRESAFLGNTAFSANPDNPGDAGGLFMNGSRLQVATCLFVGNSTGGGAGALYSVERDSAYVFNCTFRENDAKWGGAMFIENASAHVDSGVIENNTAQAGAGVVIGRTGSPLFTDTVFRNNSATSRGGAVETTASRPVFRGCSLVHNSAGNQGGGAYVTGPTVAWESCLFAGNTAGLQGGGLFLALVAADVTGCTFAGNGAPEGGGLHAASSGQVTMGTTIIAGSSEGEAFSKSDYITTVVTCSDFHGNAGGDWTGGLAALLGVDGNINADPLFIDPAVGDYRLEPESPCSPLVTDACGLIGAFGIAGAPSPVPDAVLGAGIVIEPNVPNPFNPSTTLRFVLPEAGTVRVVVYDAAGRVVCRLLDEPRPAGAQALRWDGRDDRGRAAPAGVYLYRVMAQGGSAAGRMLLLK